MRPPRPFATLLIGACLALLPPTHAAEQAGAGASFDSLTVGATTYQQVRVRSVSVRTLVITHAGGMASIRLRDLSPDLQARFHYDPAAEAAADEADRAAQDAARKAAAARSAEQQAETKFTRLLRQLGQPAVIRQQIDLRPKFFQLELSVKNQGRRPSCAIFAIVSALEFQSAEVTHRAEKFSEEYLTWAVRRSVQRPLATEDPDAPVNRSEDADLGFSLDEVVTALRAYGIPLQSSMPNTIGQGIGKISDPPEEIIYEARAHQKVSIYGLTGRDNASRLNNIVHALNAGVPVVVGMAWPHYRTLRNGFLSAQKPLFGSGHAVTLVGYTSSTSRTDDLVFFFKNSWGPEWGQGGYGTVTYNYLNQHMHAAVLLEVQAAR